jgi:hypothetical protein
MRSLAILALTVVVVAGCDMGGGTSPSPVAPAGTPLGTPLATAPSAAPTVPGPAASESATARSDTPTAEPETPAPTGAAAAAPDPSMFLQVCQGFGAGGDELPIPCSDAVAAALADPSIAGSPVSRVAVGFRCPGDASCAPPDADVAFVAVTAGNVATVLRVTRAEDESLTTVVVGRGSPSTPPPFPAPAPGRAQLPGAPASLAAREPYPLCGREDTPMGGPYDEAARRCFLDGVLAGSPVEFASVGAGTEGAGYVRLFRYPGTGGVQLVSGENGVWRRRTTGIRVAGDGLVFDIDGLSTKPEPVP